MKNIDYEKRFYREWHQSKDKLRLNVCIDESDIDIIMDPVDSLQDVISIVYDWVEGFRKDIFRIADLIPDFITTHKPLDLDEYQVNCLCAEAEILNPLWIKKMIKGSKACHVGPMATVAGVTSQLIVKNIINKYGNINIIAENGGDLYINTYETLKVAIYAGQSKLFNQLAIQLTKDTGSIGICTSSGTFGPT